MAEMQLMAQSESKLDGFLQGENWSSKYARKSFPVLVRWAEEEKANPPDKLLEHTYKDLAIAVGQPRHAHPIHEALGVLGFALRELEEVNKHLFVEAIPPIQLLVWSKGMFRPGDDAFWFLGISKNQLTNYTEASLRMIALQKRAEIIAYPHWRKVLQTLKLKPLTINLPVEEAVMGAPGFGGEGGGESEDHVRMKHYLAENYHVLGVKGKFHASIEEQVLSGDRLDLLLDSISEDGKRIGVEVKSRISDDADLIRGLFQCVKYRAVLKAHEVYKSSQSATWIPLSVHVILATERPLPDALQELATLLGIMSSVVPVPPGYEVPAGTHTATVVSAEAVCTKKPSEIVTST
jgi:hypothetical protein